MATIYITHGEVGRTISVTVTDENGDHPDFSTGTLSVEVSDKRNHTRIVLDGTPTGTSAGVLSLALTSGHFDTLPNRPEQWDVKWWHTVGGVTRSYPTDGYDTLDVTEDPQGVPVDVGTVSYLTTALAAATYLTIEDAGGLDFVPRANTQAQDTAYTQWSYTNDQDHPPWSSVFSGATYSGVWDPTWVWGNNVGAAGGKIDETKAQIYWAIEADYLAFAPGTHGSNGRVFEAYLQFKNIDNSAQPRVFSSYAFQDTGEVQVELRSHDSLVSATTYRGAVTIYGTNTSDTAVTLARFQTDGITLDQAIPFTFGAAGSYQLIRKVNAAGSATPPLLEAFGDNLRLGQGGPIWFALQSNQVGFFNTSPQSKPTGVAVTAAGIHAALVTLGLIGA